MCVRACVCVCVNARAHVRACTCVCVCTRGGGLRFLNFPEIGGTKFYKTGGISKSGKLV